MIPFFRPNMGAAEKAAAINCIERGWLTSGPKMREFEAELAKRVQAHHVVALSSNTAGLHLVLLTLGLKPEDEVIVPAITFVATAETVRAVGAKVVLCDVDFGTRNMTLESVRKVCTENTKALMMVHFAGQAPKDYVQICEWAKLKGIKVIEDAAHSFDAFYGGIMYSPVGSSVLSYATVFSFYATKCITTGGEGGAVATCDEELAKKLRVLRLHGISRDVFDRYTGKTSNWEYDVVAEGWKYNMTDLSAAIGLVQLGRSHEFLTKRENIVRQYKEGLDPSFYVQSMDMSAHSFHLFTVTVPKNRNEIIQKLFDKGVSTSVHFKPLYRLSAYATQGEFPNAEKYWLGAISLPVFPGMTEWEVNDVIVAANEAINEV